MANMTRLERFRAAIAGDEVDRIPAGVWLHFASEHLPGEAVADLHARFFAEYDWDYLKVMNDYRYPLPGVEAIGGADDLRRFEPLSMEEPGFAQQLACLRRLREALGPDVPIAETVFDPLQTVIRGAGSNAWKVIAAHPEAGRQMLESVTRTLISYVNACRDAGVTAIFFSVNGAEEPEAPAGMTDEAFGTFVAPFDKRVLEAAGGMIRIGHIHGHRLAFDRVLSYPVEAFNWAHHHTAPTLAEARKRTDAALIGGIDQVKVFEQTPAEVRSDIRAAVAEAGSRRFLVGPGCTVLPDTARRTLHAVGDAVRGLDAQTE